MNKIKIDKQKKVDGPGDCQFVRLLGFVVAAAAARGVVVKDGGSHHERVCWAKLRTTGEAMIKVALLVVHDFGLGLDLVALSQGGKGPETRSNRYDVRR
jgi:hypothetical protein